MTTNYSDYDSDGYSSNEDVDYVPDDDNLSEDDMSTCVKEDEGLDGLGDGAAPPGDSTKRKGKRKAKDLGVRKRKKGVLKLDGEVAAEESTGDPQEEAPRFDQEEENQERKEAKQKQKADDLWASFLSDVPKPKPAAPVVQSSNSQTAPPTQEKQPITAAAEPSLASPKAPEVATKVTITKVFDFAGEEVRVSKEVSADSKEAKIFLKTQETTTSPEKNTLPSRLLPAAGPSVKRPAGMSSILGQLGGKKQKMSCLEKSKMDWDTFKDEEGIGDELAIHNRGKEGYVERKNFLERVDLRQFEQEKKVRLSNMKR